MITFQDISIVIPVGPGENALEALLKDLRPIEKELEVIVVQGSSRSKQLNEGARKATRDFFWFLHADSRFTESTLTALVLALNNNPNALYYFDLHFLPDGPAGMFLNEIGCWIRSRLMGIPFGDQGFCISKINFERIGGFPEDVPYGEDHVFVWRAHQNHIRVQSTKSILKTSARKYRDQGWFRTTKRFGKLWTKQARPERKKWQQIRRGQSSAIAVFVKTPGITPLKTRLANTIGKEQALAFYKLCLETIQKTLSPFRESTRALVYPYWAVAEKQGLSDPHWNIFGRIWQGDGELGERLHHVYSTLQSVHKNVLLIGADTPHLSEEFILKAHHLLLEKKKFVIGPARDGGFYLFGGWRALPKEVWTSVTYSQPLTCDELVAKVKNFCDVFFLPTLSDVDVYEDLPFLAQELQNTIHPAQKKILQWIETMQNQKEVQWA